MQKVVHNDFGDIIEIALQRKIATVDEDSGLERFVVINTIEVPTVICSLGDDKGACAATKERSRAKHVRRLGCQNDIET